MNKSCAVVILYHPDKNTFKNINSYLPYVETLYVIDNAPSSSSSLIAKLLQHKNVIYLPQDTNNGVAEALNQAAQLALQKGFSLLLTMDQDSRFKEDVFTTYLSKVEEYRDVTVGIYSPLQSSYLFHQQVDQLTETPFSVISSGMLINLSAHQKVGGFEERYFIDCVDSEYCYRMHQNGYKILRFNDVILEHSLGETRTVSTLFKQTKVIHTHQPLRHFYITRNTIDLFFKSLRHAPHFSIATLRSLLREIKDFLLYGPQRSQKLLFTFKGIIAYFKGDWGAYRD